MALALTESIVEAGGFDPERAAAKYLAWYESGDLRGIGATTRQSLETLKEGASWRESGIREDWAPATAPPCGSPPSDCST